jgi:signal transduction histidine kinase
LVLTSAVCERQRAQRDLKEFNENLENLVHERTKALEQEIQQRKQVQDRLQVSNEELSKRNTELDNFVYSVSHDLRAPMASILGLINLAKKDDQHAVNNLYLDMMEKSARQQDHFISEILDQSRNARLEVKCEEIELKHLIEDAFDQLTYAGNPGQGVERNIHVQQSEPFYGDPWRLRMILNNLISNSIRYRNGRKPLIKVDASVQQGRLNLTVEDNGRGINAKHINNLGKMFYRATDEGAGSGLGLYIVKETLQKLQGHMTIESEEGKWTRVRLEIPDVSSVHLTESQTPS